MVTGTAFSNNHPAVVVGGGGVTVSGGGVGSNINFTYDLNGNTFQGARGDGILSAMQLASTGTMSGRIRNNTLGVVGVDRSASLEAQAIEVRLVGGGTQSITLHNNTVRNYNSNGILLEAGDNQSGGNGTFNATVTNNNVTPAGATISGANQSGIHVNFGTLDVPADTHQGCFDIRTNTSTGTGRNGAADMRVRHRQSTTLRLPGYGGAQFDTTAVQNFLLANNPNAGTRSATTSSAGGGFQNTAGGAPCATLSGPLLLGSGGIDAVAAISTDSTLFEPTSDSGAHSREGAAPKPPVAGEKKEVAAVTQSVLIQSELDAIVSVAIARWAATGLDPDQLATLRSLRFEVAELSDICLGEANGNHVRIDSNAGGNGWFIDASAQSDVTSLRQETLPLFASYTDPASAPAGRIDLLTAIMHEMGHALGLSDSYLEQDRDSLMYGYLTKGERRVPAKDQAGARRRTPAEKCISSPRRLSLERCPRASRSSLPTRSRSISARPRPRSPIKAP